LISLSLGKASAEIPPFPPLKKGGGGGILERHFTKKIHPKKPLGFFVEYTQCNSRKGSRKQET
jgi:hypothetical protein